MSGETPRPVPEGLDSWPAYWKAQGMPWSTGSDVDESLCKRSR
jgi:hypothetical protein